MSLEAHGRYISSLIQKESMEGRQLPLQAQEALEAVAKQGGSGESPPSSRLRRGLCLSLHLQVPSQLCEAHGVAAICYSYLALIAAAAVNQEMH